MQACEFACIRMPDPACQGSRGLGLLCRGVAAACGGAASTVSACLGLPVERGICAHAGVAAALPWLLVQTWPSWRTCQLFLVMGVA